MVSIELYWDEAGNVECDWGQISSMPRPDRGEVGHLILAERSYIDRLLEEPDALHIPPFGPQIGFHSVTTQGDRIFAHHHYNGTSWTWELFPAHWADALGPEVFIGRWPD